MRIKPNLFKKIRARVYSGRTSNEILNTSPDFLKQIGLDTHLSPTRKNGLGAMISKIKSSAAELN